MTDDDRRFTDIRARLLRIARGRLDVPADAEDVVQDAWLRWRTRGTGAPVDAAAWLATVVAHLCTDRLRHAQVVRDHARHAPPADEVAASPEALLLHERAVRDALADLLRAASALEAAAWLLREVMDADYDAIARLLQRSPDACRQLVHRARARLRRPPSSPPVERPLVERCLHAIRSADHRALVAALMRQPVTQGRDRTHERIRLERRPGGAWVAVTLGDVLLAVVPADAIDTAHRATEVVDAA